MRRRSVEVVEDEAPRGAGRDDLCFLCDDRLREGVDGAELRTEELSSLEYSATLERLSPRSRIFLKEKRRFVELRAPEACVSAGGVATAAVAEEEEDLAAGGGVESAESDGAARKEEDESPTTEEEEPAAGGDEAATPEGAKAAAAGGRAASEDLRGRETVMQDAGETEGEDGWEAEGNAVEELGRAGAPPETGRERPANRSWPPTAAGATESDRGAEAPAAEADNRNAEDIGEPTTGTDATTSVLGRDATEGTGEGEPTAGRAAPGGPARTTELKRRSASGIRSLTMSRASVREILC